MANGMIPNDLVSRVREATAEELGTPEERKATREKLDAARAAFFKNRVPTDKEREKLERSRQLMQSGIMGEKDFLSRILPTSAKAARDEMKQAEKLRESVPMSAREGEAYEQAGYKKGGKTKAYKNGGYVRSADGVAQRGKTKGRIC